MRITIRVRPEAASALRGRGPATSAFRQLLSTADDLGIVLEPIHPQGSDPRLAAYYTAEVPDRAAAERALADFRQCSAVEAAYLKPPDALP